MAQFHLKSSPDGPVAQGLADVSSAAYAETQILKALGSLKKFSSEGEIVQEGQLSEKRVREAIGRLATDGLLEPSLPGTGELWRLSDEGLDVLRGINIAEMHSR